MMSDTPLRVRASAHPLFWTCPSSQRPTQNPWNRPNAAAALGTAVHEALACFVRTGSPPDLGELAAAHGVDDEELAKLVFYGVASWDSLQRFFSAPVVEQFLDDPRAPGTADVRDWSEDQAAILDWKSGWIMGDAHRQTRAYAFLLWCQHGRQVPKCGFITSIVVYLRHRKIVVHRYSQANLEQFEAEHDQQSARVGKDYAPGDHCGFCQRFGVCRAREQWSRAGLRALTATVSSAPTAEELVALRPQAKQLERLLGEYNKALRAAVLAQGSIPLGDGRSLVLEDRTRTSINPLKAWPLLTGALSPEEISDCLTVGKTALEKAISDKAPRGQKGKAKAHFMDQLKAAGAVSENAHSVLSEVATPQQVDQGGD